MSKVTLLICPSSHVTANGVVVSAGSLPSDPKVKVAVDVQVPSTGAIDKVHSWAGIPFVQTNSKDLSAPFASKMLALAFSTDPAADVAGKVTSRVAVVVVAASEINANWSTRIAAGAAAVLITPSSFAGHP